MGNAGHQLWFVILRGRKACPPGHNRSTLHVLAGEIQVYWVLHWCFEVLCSRICSTWFGVLWIQNNGRTYQHIYCKTLWHTYSCKAHLKKKERASVIYTDSLSAVTALSSTTIHNNPVTNTLAKCIMSAHKSKLKITLSWIPGHCSIASNEAADRLAKSAVLHQSVDIVPYEDLRPLIWTRMCRQ